MPERSPSEKSPSERSLAENSPSENSRTERPQRSGLSDDHIAAALRGYAAGGPVGVTAGSAAGARVRQEQHERQGPPAAGLLLYALLLGLAAGVCCAAVTLL